MTQFPSGEQLFFTPDGPIPSSEVFAEASTEDTKDPFLDVNPWELNSRALPEKWRDKIATSNYPGVLGGVALGGVVET